MSSGEGNSNPLQYSCLENPVDRGTWWAAVHRVTQSRTQLKRLSIHACIGEGRGNPLQYSCLENPRDRGAWWAAVYGVTQSRTQLKRLSSRMWALGRHVLCLGPWSIPSIQDIAWIQLLSSRVQLFVTPWTSLPGSSVHGISQARTLKWVPFPSPEYLPNPGIEPVSPTSTGGVFITEPPGIK